MIGSTCCLTHEITAGGGHTPIGSFRPGSIFQPDRIAGVKGHCGVPVRKNLLVPRKQQSYEATEIRIRYPIIAGSE
jgi:hypothetical protein